ncbi:MAG: starch phosphorylase [Cyclobacteriaceae bacterium]|jgi:starch phosphorylase
MEFTHPYKYNKDYKKSVAYFCMEFAIDQPLKIYSGGLGFLAGSHMRSAYELKQNVVGIGMLWNYGYYDQVRKENNELGVLIQEKHYTFLEDTGIVVDVNVHGQNVKVKAMLLKPETFGNAPIFLLSTKHPENDYLSKTITDKLYDNNLSTRIAQYIVLGIGGAKVLEQLNHKIDMYHFNEAHALPAAFHLLQKLGGDKEKLKEQLLFTTHTPVKAGNEVNDPKLLSDMGYFNHLSIQEVENLVGFEYGQFNHSLAALRLAKKSNAVSKKHKEVSDQMWGGFEGTCEIIAITNAQNRKYWTDPDLEQYYEAGDDEAYVTRKKRLKQHLFNEVADQTGKLFDPNVLTIVWARRFAGYKRADLITRDFERFASILRNTKHPVQIIWGGKPYPLDHGSVDMFNRLVHFLRPFPNATILTGYELRLSALMKRGSDIWLNNPRIPLEASGTSGMTASMNGSVNFSTNDGWVLEFARHGENAFIVPEVDQSLSEYDQDLHDMHHMYDILENEILPTYYDNPKKWNQIVKQGMEDVNKDFRAQRMADEYYKNLYLS